MVNMEAYMARVVCLTSVDTETPSEKQQRYERMTTLFDTKRVMLPPPPPRTSRHRVMVVLLRAWARRVLATRVVYTWWKRVQLQARIVKKYSGRRQQSILTPSSNNIKFQWYKEQDMPFPFSMFNHGPVFVTTFWTRKRVRGEEKSTFPIFCTTSFTF